MINKKKRFIFIHIPKTGGKSVEKYFFNRFIKNPHRKALKLMLELDSFSDYYIFSFIRNPFDRIISIYRHYKQGGNQGFKDIAIKKWISKLSLSEFILKLPQLKGCPFYYEIETMVMPQISYIQEQVNVHSFDNFENEVHKIANLTSFEIKDIPHKNKSRGSIPILSDEDKKIILELYKEDFELYNSLKHN